jgi:hypothetical protein
MNQDMAKAYYAGVRAGWMWITVVGASFALNYARTRFWGPREEWREAARFALRPAGLPHPSELWFATADPAYLDKEDMEIVAPLYD